MNLIIATLQDALTNVRWSDLLDVGLTTIVAYALLSWLGRSRSRYVSLGVVGLALGYVVARWLHLSLTLQAFHAGLAVAAVAIVVIFQEEIRRSLERAVLGSIGNGSGGPAVRHKDIDVLATSLWKLAQNRTGALVLLEGHEPLGRHLDGGIELGGAISEPLLLSLFDPSSPGHDGAIVISDGRIRSFGAHLPLSHRIDADAPFGTRHTAAIGMSERSDALLIVVSEERGTVHTAQAGTLRLVSSKRQLEQAIEAHLDRLSPAARRQRLPGRLTTHLGTKLLATSLSIALWISVVGPDRQTFVRTLTVPVTLRDIPANLLFDSPRPSHVQVTVAGPREAFRRLDTSTLQLTVPANHLGAGIRRVVADATQLDLPDELSVHRIVPQRIAIVAQATKLRKLPVKIVTTGRLPHSRALVATSFKPTSVHVWVPTSLMGKLVRLRTEPIDLGHIQTSTTRDVPLELPDGIRLRTGESDTIRVQITVKDDGAL